MREIDRLATRLLHFDTMLVPEYAQSNADLLHREACHRTKLLYAELTINGPVKTASLLIRNGRRTRKRIAREEKVGILLATRNKLSKRDRCSPRRWHLLHRWPPPFRQWPLRKRWWSRRHLRQGLNRGCLSLQKWLRLC